MFFLLHGLSGLQSSAAARRGCIATIGVQRWALQEDFNNRFWLSWQAAWRAADTALELKVRLLICVFFSWQRGIPLGLLGTVSCACIWRLGSVVLHLGAGFSS